MNHIQFYDPFEAKARVASAKDLKEAPKAHETPPVGADRPVTPGREHERRRLIRDLADLASKKERHKD